MPLRVWGTRMGLFSKLSGNSGQHQVILTACFPKSASTYISRNMAAILGYEVASLSGSRKSVSDPGNHLVREHDLTYGRLKKKCRKNIVAQNHTLATTENVGLINHFNITTFVLVRNLFDICMSYRDHILKDPNRDEVYAAYSEGYEQWSQERQLDFVIDLIIPWYIKFYVSWSRQDAFIVSYEDMVENPPEFFKRVFEYCGHDFSESEIAEKLDIKRQPEGRFNKGVVGRGSELSQSQQDRIIKYTEYYPDINFDQVLKRSHSSEQSTAAV